MTWQRRAPSVLSSSKTLPLPLWEGAAGGVLPRYERLIYHTPWPIRIIAVDPPPSPLQTCDPSLLLARWTSRMSTLPGDSTLAGASAAPHAGRTASARTHRRRPFGNAVLHAPQTLRALVRTDEVWLVVLSAFVGCGAGILVWMMTAATQLVHQTLFLISSSQRLSAMVELDPLRTVVVPAAGGLAL